MAADAMSLWEAYDEDELPCDCPLCYPYDDDDDYGTCPDCGAAADEEDQ